MYEEPNMEKLTINLPPIEIARIDILVEAGYYPSRAEFIRAAVRKTLDAHQDFVGRELDKIASASGEALSDQGLVSRIAGVGVYHLSREAFEQAVEQRKKMAIMVVGILSVDKNVTPEHVDQAVESVRVYGVLRASPKVKAALQRKKQGGFEDR